MTELLHSRYRLVEVIGRGSMGTVWEAEDTLLDRHVALKELHPSVDIDPDEARDRFLVEARAAARLTHPNIVGIHDVFTDGSRVLIAMELVRGRTLDQLRKAAGPQPAHVVRAILAQVAQALAVAHAEGIVHRDLKPDNVFWTDAGRAVVADFGLARIGLGRGTVEGTIMGTPGYMAPEQVRGQVAGTQADVFGWGAMGYELATGRPAFGEASGTDPSALVYRIVHESPAPLDLPEDPALTVLITRALAKDPADRPIDGAALVVALSLLPLAATTAGAPVMAPLAAPPPPVAVKEVAASSLPLAASSLPPVVTGEAAAVSVATPAGSQPAVASSGSWLRRRSRSIATLERDKPPSSALIVLAALVLLGLVFLVAFNGPGTPGTTGNLGAGKVTINGLDPASGAELSVDLTRPLVIEGTVDPGAASRLRLEFTALGVPLGSGSTTVNQQDDGAFKVKVDASDSARFFVGGRVTGKLTLYGLNDEFGLPKTLGQTFPMASTQSSLRTVPTAIAVVLVLFLLAYLKSSIYWLVYGTRRGFETSNLLLGGALVGVTVVLLAWLLGSPQPTMAVLVVCVLLALASSIAVTVAAYRFAQRREANEPAA